MRTEIEEILIGSFDFRVHANPDTDIERRVDFLEAGRDAHEAQMTGFVYLSHHQPTAPMAYALNRMYPGLKTIGSIALNKAVGGINPDAVTVAANLGARVVWMPTRSADIVPVTDTAGELLPEVINLLDVVKEHDLVLASTHISVSDTIKLFDEAKSRDIGRLIVSNPATRMNNQHIEYLKSLGVFFELPFYAYQHEAPTKIVSDIAMLGADHCIVATDFGHWMTAPPAEGMRLAIAMLLQGGLTPEEASRLVADNPLGLVIT